MNISWEASDLDGNSLTYAILLSQDDGATYSTLDFDINATNYSINSLDLLDGDNYLIRILATDGVNTNFTLANTTFTIDNDLQIKEFSAIYSNLTQQILRISLNNTLNQTISNITWMFNTGESIKNSTYVVDLQFGEEMLFFVHVLYPNRLA